jgi:hypothetical protein
VSQYIKHVQLGPAPSQSRRCAVNASRSRYHLPYTMNTLWAGSDRNMNFGDHFHSGLDSKAFVASAPHPFPPRFPSARDALLGFNVHVTKHAATRDTGPSAKSYSCGSLTLLSSNHFQYARSTSCYAIVGAGGHPQSFEISAGPNHQHRFISRCVQSARHVHDSKRADSKYTLWAGRHQMS